MLCIWKNTQVNKWVCIRCGAERINQTLPKRECDSDTSNCKYRSQESIRKQECPSCSGNIQIKVFACSIHGECCLSDKLSDIQNCYSCKDFVAKE